MFRAESEERTKKQQCKSSDSEVQNDEEIRTDCIVRISAG